MAEDNWEVIGEVAGDLQAEMLRGLLEASGYKVWLSQEGAGKAYGLTLSTLGAVQILVPSESAENARIILDNYYAGLYEKEDLQPDTTASPADQEENGNPEDDSTGAEPTDQG